MDLVIKNQRVEPKFYYGLHFGDGVAEYRNLDGTVHRKYVSADTAKKMNSTFQGKPLKIQHPEESIDFKNLKSEDVDGWVIESFYNKKDGKHWAKILVLNPLAEEKIKEGWQLSNAYFVTGTGVGGEYQGVPYDMEVVDAEYEHLALVSEPRYEYSKILTEEEFEAYNSEKEIQLENRFINSKEKETTMLNFFKREKVKNDNDLKDLSVELPKSKKEMTLEKIINMADEEMIKRSQNPDMFCLMTDKVKMANGEVSTIENLLTKLSEAEKAINEYKMKEEESSKNEDDVDEVIEEELVEDSSDEEEEEEKEENASDEEKEKKSKNSKEDHVSKILNAEKKQMNHITKNTIVIGSEGLSIGKQRYGS